MGGPASEHEHFVKKGDFYGSSDASWLLRSIGGYVIMMANGPLDWTVRIFRVICHSSAEAEIGAASLMHKRLAFVLQLLSDMKLKGLCPVIVFVDNTAALELCQKLGVTAKTAHFLRWLYYFRLSVLNKLSVPYFCPTKLMLADAMTKVVDSATLQQFFDIILNKKNRLV